MRKVAALVLAGTIILKFTIINVAFAGDYDDAREASAIMAAVKIYNTSISEDLRRGLYAQMLAFMRTPSQINFSIDQEVEALNKQTISFGPDGDVLGYYGSGQIFNELSGLAPPFSAMNSTPALG
jgi:hypothetical protein